MRVHFAGPGWHRQRLQWAILLLAVLLLGFVAVEAASKQRLWMPFTALTGLLTLIFCRLLWLELRPPAASWDVQLQDTLTLSCRHQRVRVYPLTHLRGMLLIRTAQRRLWLFADETSPASWRQLLMHTRFAR